MDINCCVSPGCGILPDSDDKPWDLGGPNFTSMIFPLRPPFSAGISQLVMFDWRVDVSTVHVS